MTGIQVEMYTLKLHVDSCPVVGREYSLSRYHHSLGGFCYPLDGRYTITLKGTYLIRFSDILTIQLPTVAILFPPIGTSLQSTPQSRSILGFLLLAASVPVGYPFSL